MSALVEFLEACIADDERDGCPCRWVDEDRDVCDARWKAECEAKRQIIAAESWVRVKSDAPAHRRMSMGGETTIDLPLPGGSTELRGDAARAFIDEWYEPSPPSRVLYALAAVYADRPGYRQEWRPTRDTT